MSPDPDRDATHERTLERIDLCALTVRQTLSELGLETDPERRADLLLATEELAAEVAELLTVARDRAWHLPTTPAHLHEG